MAHVTIVLGIITHELALVRNVGEMLYTQPRPMFLKIAFQTPLLTFEAL